MTPLSRIGVAEFQARMKSGAIVIDIRTPEEIREGKIDGAREMNCFDADFGDRIMTLDRAKEYLLYCRSGHRSKQVLEILGSLGFQNICDLEGGIQDWIRSGNVLS